MIKILVSDKDKMIPVALMVEYMQEVELTVKAILGSVNEDNPFDTNWLGDALYELKDTFTTEIGRWL